MKTKNNLHFSGGNDPPEISEKEMLTFAVDSGMLDIATIREKIMKKRKETYLSMNPYNIWQGSNGFWYSYLPDESKRKQIKRKSKDEVEDIIIEYWQSKEINPTVRQMFDEWQARRLDLGKVSPATIIRNEQIFQRFFADNMGNRKIKSIKDDTLITWLEDQVVRYELTAKAFNNLKTVLRGTFKFARRKGFTNIAIETLLAESDMTDLKFRKVYKDDSQEVYDEDESERFVQYLEQSRTQCDLCLLLMWVTGMRIGEVVVLRHEDIGSTYVYVRGTATRYYEDDHWVRKRKDFPKTEAGWRKVVLPDKYLWLLSEVDNLNPDNQFVFVGGDGDFLSPQSIRTYLNRVNEKLKIVRKSPHKIRKTYGTILLDANVDKRFILTQMGHADILTTETHYHRNRKSIDRRQEIISQIPDFQ